MLFEKKKAAAAILSKMDSGGRRTETEVAHESGGEHNVYTNLAEDMIAAFRDGSVNKMASVLKCYHSMIQDEDDVKDAEG